MTEPAPPPNPLTEASPTSLEELFSRDLAAMPREARRASIMELVADYRAKRLRWKQEEAAGATRASTGARKKAPKAGATSLSDLGLD
jgi:hypothetical protein